MSFIEDLIEGLTLKSATSVDPGFAQWLDKSYKQPIEQKFGMKNKLQARNSEYFWNALKTGRVEGFTPEEQKAADFLTNITPFSGPTKVASVARRFIPAGREAGIDLMGQAVRQRSFPLITGQTGSDFIQGGAQLARQGGGVLSNLFSLFNRSKPQQLIQGRTPTGQFSNLIEKR